MDFVNELSLRSVQMSLREVPRMIPVHFSQTYLCGQLRALAGPTNNIRVLKDSVKDSLCITGDNCLLPNFMLALDVF